MTGCIAVTGDTGFIGRHLVTELRRQGRRLAAPMRYEIGVDTDWSARLDGVEVLIHLAALAHERARVHERTENYQALQRVNALGTEHLARAAGKAGVRHFIFLSTIGVCGEQTFGRPFTEDCQPAPQSLYATSKWEAEGLLGAVAARTGMQLTVLRPTLVYGPGNRGNLLRLLHMIDRGWPLPFAGVNNKRSLTSVHNLISAIVTLMERRASGTECFLVADAQPLSTAEIVTHLAAGMRRPARLWRIPGSALELAARAFGQQNLARRLLGSLEVDSSKLTKITGWRAPIAASRGLIETGEWFRGR